MKWNGLLAGLGQGMQAAGAVQWELAKEKRLEAIRKQERIDRREDARIDREARKADAKELAQWEKDNAGTWEQVKDESGKVVAQRHSVTGETKPLNIDASDDRIARAFDIIKAVQAAGGRDLVSADFQRAFDSALPLVASYLEGTPGASGGAGDGAPGGGSRLDEIASKMAEEKAARAEADRKARLGPVTDSTPDPVMAGRLGAAAREAAVPRAGQPQFAPSSMLFGGPRQQQEDKPDWMRVFR